MWAFVNHRFVRCWSPRDLPTERLEHVEGVAHTTRNVHPPPASQITQGSIERGVSTSGFSLDRSQADSYPLPDSIADPIQQTVDLGAPISENAKNNRRTYIRAVYSP